MLTGFFQDSDFIVVLQTGFWSGSGFLPLGSRLESDSKKLESEHLWSEHLSSSSGWWFMAKKVRANICRLWFFWVRCQAKLLACEISDIMPCAHPQSNILQYTDKIDC